MGTTSVPYARVCQDSKWDSPSLCNDAPCSKSRLQHGWRGEDYMAIPSLSLPHKLVHPSDLVRLEIFPSQVTCVLSWSFACSSSSPGMGNHSHLESCFLFCTAFLAPHGSQGPEEKADSSMNVRFCTVGYFLLSHNTVCMLHLGKQNTSSEFDGAFQPGNYIKEGGKQDQ